MLVFINAEVDIDAPAGQQLLKSNAIHLRDPGGLGKRDVLLLVQKNRNLPEKIFGRGPGRFDVMIAVEIFRTIS